MSIQDERTARRRGATPVWLVCAIVAAGLSWLVTDLNEHTSDAGYTAVDPSRVAFELVAGSAGIPPCWSEIVAVRIARLGELSTLDDDSIANIVEELEDLPFILEVGDAHVLWPDGLNVKIRLREPVACVCLGEDYLPVASDGMVLPGYRPTPPDFGRGILPVIGPVDETFLDWRPGDVLFEERHLDALSIAVSMREHLSRGDLDVLGPLVIDASRAERAAIDEPGTRLWLEGGRTVFFGRPPRAGAPGELPDRLKWTHLMKAVGTLGREGRDPSASSWADWSDWDLVDVRWDVPTLRPRIGYR